MAAVAAPMPGMDVSRSRCCRNGGVSIEVIVDLSFERRHFIVQRVDQMLDRGADDRTAGVGREAIPLLLSHALEGIEPANQRLQLAQLRSSRACAACFDHSSM
jgi:hypothetical protein